ncbi:hypothetical protein NW762_008115 [Fusarium torreyae]|uniref:Avirulence Effector AvrLm4-7 domain-containing protein n=1 Tax=Fusarium torreyae TaxID=1237075 RepID=A0A9W8RZL6_9HYPO|nr:hypothetical protein NW762_008115 [Fusarium torreyae]
MALLKLFAGAGALLRVGAFDIYHVDDFDTKRYVGEPCAKAMLAYIACHEYVRSWYQQFGHNPYSIGDVALTDAICTDTCSGSLRTWFETVSKDCQKELLGDGDFVSTEYVGIMWAHWNETCLKDEKSGKILQRWSAAL